MRTSTLAVLLAGLAVGRASGQMIRVDRDTQIRSVTFDARGPLAIDDRQMLDRVSIRGRGGAIGLRRALGWVPFVPEIVERPFDPLDLQRDKERLRRFLVTTGYHDVAVDYDVTFDAESNAVDVVFLIDPGPPTVLRALTVEFVDPAESDGLDADQALRDVRLDLALRENERFDERDVAPAVAALARWLGERSFAFAQIEPVVSVDEDADAVDVVLRADTGPRARIGEIRIEGNADLRTNSIRGLLTVRSGDTFSPVALQTASQRLTSLDVIRRASFEIPPDQPPDSTVDVLLRVREQPQRGVSGRAGYATDGGLAGDAQWTHRNIFLGAQTLTFNLSGQSGVLALAETPDKFIRGSITYRTPVRGRTYLTVSTGPFAEFRDDFRDRSVEVGIESTLLYQITPLTTVALRYELATRRIMEYRFGDISAGVDFFELLDVAAEGVTDSLGARIGTSTLSLSSAIGTLDAPTEPRRGFLIEPSVSVAFPGALSAIEYLNANVRASGYLPLSRTVTLAARFGAGHIYPFGKSVPADPMNSFGDYVRLREVLFTAGGAGDVRGWADRSLGPKFPQIVITPADSTVEFTADRYTPIGGFNRLHGSLELRFPLPLVGSDWGAHVFADAGRIWTGDTRFTSSDDPYGVHKLFWASGFGVDYRTPIGTIRVSGGFKMNPSILDDNSPQTILDAIIDEVPLNALPRSRKRRFQLHIGLGTRL